MNKGTDKIYFKRSDLNLNRIAGRYMFYLYFSPNPVAKVDYVLTIISLGLILGLVVGVVTAYFVSRRIMFYPNNPLEEARCQDF